MSESAGGNRNALNRPIGPDGKRDWSYGLFDCFSAYDFCTWNLTIANVFSHANANRPFTPPHFLKACLAGCCPHIAYTQEIQHLRSLQHQGTALPANSERNDDQCCIPKALQVTPCMHVRSEDMRYEIATNQEFWTRFASSKKPVSAMAFVAVCSAIAAFLRGAFLVVSLGRTGKSSWKR
jgi:hypothetical protein